MKWNRAYRQTSTNSLTEAFYSSSWQQENKSKAKPTLIYQELHLIPDSTVSRKQCSTQCRVIATERGGGSWKRPLKSSPAGNRIESIPPTPNFKVFKNFKIWQKILLLSQDNCGFSVQLRVASQQGGR